MIKSLLFSAAILAASQTSAAIVVDNLGVITVPPTVSFSPGDTFSNGTNSGWYEFTTTSALTLTASSFTNTAIGSHGQFNFSTIGLYSGTGVSGTELETGSIVARNSFGQTTAGLNVYSLAPGAYTIAYTGTVPGKTGTVGSSITFAPGVPEPSSWAMMLAGFGLIGVSVRRRSRTMVAA